MNKLLRGVAGVALCGAVLFGLNADARAQGWSGFYAGINLGASWTDSDIGFSGANGGAYPQSYFSQVLATGGGNVSESVFSFGGQIGYNIQNSNVLWGIEGDLNTLGTRTTRGVLASPSGFNNAFVRSDTVEADWLGTLRARLGIVSGPAVYYVTGGFAFTNMTLTSRFADSGSPVLVEGASRSETRTGWTIGGGIEWALGSNWSLKGEYLYADFGSLDTMGAVINTATGASASQPPTVFGHSADLTVQTVRAGLNYRF